MIWPLLALLAVGCTEYGLKSPDGGAPPARRDDTGGPPVGGEDSGTGDACWEPEDGYSTNPAARLVMNGDGPITVSLVLSDTSYRDTLWIDSPVATGLWDAWTTPMGSAVTLGPFGREQEVVFAVQVQDTGMHWQSGPASRNSDGVVHGAVSYEGDCSWLMGFEDLTGGGDLDYNDVVMRVQGDMRQEG